ncbi:hypothetical protein HN873_033777 [Arachis hypogaea]
MSTNEDDVKNDSDNDLGDDFDYQPNVEDDAEDDDMDSLDSTRQKMRLANFITLMLCWHGFVMRKDDTVRDNEGRIICRQLVCNKEGWRNMRYLDLDDRSREASHSREPSVQLGLGFRLPVPGRGVDKLRPSRDSKKLNPAGKSPKKKQRMSYKKNTGYSRFSDELTPTDAWGRGRNSGPSNESLASTN